MKRHYTRSETVAAFLCVLCLCLPACAPLIGPYSPTAYQNATSIKAETLAIMDKASGPYSDHEKKVAELLLDIDKAYEYVHGVPSDDLSGRQWAILRQPDGALLGRFFGKWKAEGTLGRVYIDEFKGVISDAFDEIICLEANRKAAARCSVYGGRK